MQRRRLRRLRDHRCRLVHILGQVALRALRQAAPDGKTLLIAPFAMAVLGPLTTPNEPFAPGRDFAPIGQLAEYSIAFAVGAQVPARTMQEYVEWVRQHPASAAVGVPTAGSLPHLYTLLLGQAGKVDLVVVPYRELAAPPPLTQNAPPPQVQVPDQTV